MEEVLLPPPAHCSGCHSTEIALIESQHEYECRQCRRRIPYNINATKRTLFISYGHSIEQVLARRLFHDLKAVSCYTVFFDEDYLKAGVTWAEEIEKALEMTASDIMNARMLYLMSRHSVREERYCRKIEIDLAQKRGIDILPVRVEDCEIPANLAGYQYLNMLDCLPLADNEPNYQVGLRQLIAAIEYPRLNFDINQKRLQDTLKPDTATIDLTRHQRHFTGRQWVFDHIDNWLHDANALRVCWIVGPPVIGKSALAAHIMPRVQAAHFCWYTDKNSADPSNVVRSIALQLSAQLPEFQKALLATGVNSEKLDKLNNDADALFRCLIMEPLAAITEPPEAPIVMLIDALDEASSGGKNELARLIATHLPATRDWLRVIVTSRPDEPAVRHWLQGYKPLDLDTEENRDDMRKYIENNLAQYFAHGMPPEAVDIIIARSEGLFLYVEWLLEEARQHPLTIEQIHALPQGMNGVYARLFNRQFPDIAVYKETILPVLAVIVAASEPLGVEDLMQIVPEWNAYKARDFFQQTGSLFREVNGVIQPFHSTVSEWMTDSKKADNYYVDPQHGHELLADQGFERYYKEEDLRPYLLNHLPYHLGMAKRYDKLDEILRDDDFLAAQGDSVFDSWYRFEHPEWLSAMAAWVKYLFSRQYPDPKLALVLVADAYFGAFWWWSENVDFPFCAQVLSTCEKAAKTLQQKELMKALREFDASFPKKHACRTRVATPEIWKATRKALEQIRKNTVCDGIEADLLDDKPRMQLRMLTDIYLGEACDLLDPGSGDAIYEEACRLAREMDDCWNIAYIRALQGEALLRLNKAQEAIDICNEGFKDADKDDMEEYADLFRVIAGARVQKNEIEAANRAFTVAVAYAYLSHTVQHCTPADTYTIAYYADQVEGWLDFIQTVQSADPLLALTFCRKLHEFWRPYRKIFRQEDGDCTANIESALAEQNREALAAMVLPPNPAAGSQEHADLIDLVREEIAGELYELATAVIDNTAYPIPFPFSYRQQAEKKRQQENE